MSMKMKAIIAALAAAAAGGAQAAINPGASAPPTGDGELFVSVYDATHQISYTRDLGVTVPQFLANPGAPLSFAHDSLYTGTFGSADPGTLVWNLVGLQDTQTSFSDPAEFPKWGVLVTSAAGEAAMSANGFQNAAAAIGNGDVYVAAVNGNAVAQNSGATLGNYAQNLSSTATGGFGYYAGGSFGDTFVGSLLTSDQAAVGQGMGFYHIGMKLDSSGQPVLDTDGNILGAVTAFPGTWTLAANGDLSYVAPVPEADTWVLMLAGLGLVGMASTRKRKPADAAFDADRVVA